MGRPKSYTRDGLPRNRFQHSCLMRMRIKHKNGINSNPANFAELAVQAIKHLQEKGKSNLLYKFAVCIANNRPGSNGSLFLLTECLLEWWIIR